MQSTSPEGPERRQSRLLALCSRDLDHDLNSREKAELARLRKEFAGVAERFESDARGLGGLLRQLPVAEVPEAVHQQIAVRIRSAQSRLQRTSGQPDDRHRRRGRWLVSLIAVGSLAACLVVSILVQRNQVNPAAFEFAAADTSVAADAESCDQLLCFLR